MMQKDISVNLNQKCLILCSKILLNVLHNTSLAVWQYIGFQTYPILQAFVASLAFLSHICKWCLTCIIQQAYKFVSSTLYPRLTFFELKNTNILKWNLEFYVVHPKYQEVKI